MAAPDPALQKVKPHRARDGCKIITIKNRISLP